MRARKDEGGPWARLSQHLIRHRLAPAAIGTAGAALVVWRYLQPFALWRDEAALAVAVLRTPLVELVGPLAYGQEAPLGFLVVQHLLVRLLGDSDHVHRLIPFVFCLTSIPLFWLAARRVLERGPALAAFLFYLSGTAFYYFATNAKQYGVDVLACVGLLCLGTKVLEEPRRAAVAAL